MTLLQLGIWVSPERMTKSRSDYIDLAFIELFANIWKPLDHCVHRLYDKVCHNKTIPDGGAIETAKFLVEDVILKHGAPREMITDRGRNFISQVIKEINALCGIVHRFTTAYHPQTNGLTERFNKTLGDMLPMYTGVEQKDWNQVLPYVTFAYNTAKQEATGHTPFFLVHVREAETYIDAVLPYLPDETSDDYVGELVTRAEEARQLSRSRLLQSQAKDRRLYDQKHTPVYYQKDDLVWVFTPIRKVGLSEKLLKRYFGPYKVTKKLSEVTYEVEPVDPSPRSRKAKDIVHETEMSVKSEMEGSQSTRTSFTCLQQPRNPSAFGGKDSECPYQWLRDYDRVSRHNGWDESLCLANVIFYLEGTAKCWFENVEESLNSWPRFKEEFLKIFGDQEHFVRKAESKLKIRAQRIGEPSESYIQDILNLCRQVNPAMGEVEKLARLMKGVAEDIFQALLPVEMATVDEFSRQCRRIEDRKKKRFGVAYFERLANVASISGDSDLDFESLIRKIIKEEIGKALSCKSPLTCSEQLENEKEDSPSRPADFQAALLGQLTGKTKSRDPQGSDVNPPSTKADLDSNYLMVVINGNKVRALVDTGASYSVISDAFRRKLNIVMFEGPRMTLKVANNRFVSPIGKCIVKLEISNFMQAFEFLVLSGCSHDVILGWNLLEASRAIIDCGRSEIAFSETIDDESRDSLKRFFVEEEYIVPPKSSKMITVSTSEVAGRKSMIAEGSRKLLLDKEISIPASLITVLHGKAELWITNFSTQTSLIPSGMCVAYFSEIDECGICSIDDSQHPAENTPPCDQSSVEINIEPCIAPERAPEEKQELLKLVNHYAEIFGPVITSRKSQDSIKHCIITGDSAPIRRMPYRVSPAERRIIQNEVDKMIEADVIQPSESPWASPVVLVKKKDGSWRFCVDYRGLNKITKKDVYPLPRIDDALDCLREARMYSTMDLKTGYWQIEIDEEDREKTAFITPDGLFEFKVMPFGLCNAPRTFERMMDSLLRGLRWTTCLCYLDDVVVYSATFSEHLSRLGAVLNCFRKAGLRLNLRKCCFGADQIKILGHQIDQDGVRPDYEKIKAIAEYPTPANLQQLRSFLGLSSYYRRFIKGYADISRPLNELLCKLSTFKWEEKQENSFESLKRALSSKPVLGHFDESAPTEVHCDASGFGIGAILVQIHVGRERVIAYASRTLIKAERNYSTTERECLAVVWAIGKFRPYLFGRPFKVVTDHHSLCWLANLKDPSGRLARWALRLQEYDISIAYKTGMKHRDADCLSRNPIKDKVDEMYDDFPFLSTIMNIKDEQKQDPYILKILDGLSDSTSKDNRFKIVNGILYKKNFDPNGPSLLLVVPRRLRSDILRELHDAPMAGHLGFAKTYDRVIRRYFWPGLYRSVKKYVSHCQECQRRKNSPQLPPGHLVPIPPPSRPFQKIGIDLLGRFPLSRNKKRWIIVCTDYLSKYAITKSLATGDAQGVANFLLEEVILIHGAPREIVTDRGRNFQSKLIQELANCCGIIKRSTTAYHPQTNGLTERLNRTMADMLSMYVDLDQKNWDEILPFVTFAYNTAKQEATRFTPFFLVHGREAETPLDALFPYPETTDSDEYIQELETKAEEARQIARFHILKAQDVYKTNYDSKHRRVAYHPGDLVWIYIPVRRVGLCEKLMRRYFGPYHVTRKLSDVTYEVRPVEDQGRRHRTKDIVHVLRMKPYHGPIGQED
ncbi:K02A2.6-like [Cordylochernes scorpioides]|uniref:RNA-directed DNA polymerase n=1 Tax=Cordylochernes scorpioides TaxID=51811 RepID=A0ABY6JZN7_9ARAC|nr:K02A2.6-like [Cordylochernes scorpioides]